MSHPHVIYILSDEHFGGAMSHAGDPNVETPNMDALAQGGVSFSRAYSNCPICTPSRGTIFSGRHAHAGPVQFFFDVYKPAAPSTATCLREAGYHTAYFGKWHCGVVRNQIPPEVRNNSNTYPGTPNRTPEYHRAGFQDWYGFEINNAPFDGFYYNRDDMNPTRMEKYQTDALTDLAIDYLSSYDNDQPLFLTLSVEPPHFPLEAPEEYQRWNPADLKVKSNFEDTPEMREQLAIYYAMVENLDHNMGRLRDVLNDLPSFKDNTLLVYISDHGDYMGSHGAIKRKEHPHEESVRIPALFNWPGHIPKTGVRGELFGLVDLLPTTLGLLGLDIPSHVQGQDFSPALRDESFEGPDAQLIEMSGNPRWSLDFLDWRGVVTMRYKYAFYETGHELLFDLENDPEEQNNLAQIDVQLCGEMRDKLLQLLEETRDPYFDVLIQHGVRPESPVIDTAGQKPGPLAPTWDDMIQKNDN